MFTFINGWMLGVTYFFHNNYLSVCLKGEICRFRAGGVCVRFTREILYVSYKTDCNNNNTRLIHQREWGVKKVRVLLYLSPVIMNWGKSHQVNIEVRGKL